MVGGSYFCGDHSCNTYKHVGEKFGAATHGSGPQTIYEQHPDGVVYRDGYVDRRQTAAGRPIMRGIREGLAGDSMGFTEVDAGHVSMYVEKMHNMTMDTVGGRRCTQLSPES